MASPSIFPPSGEEKAESGESGQTVWPDPSLPLKPVGRVRCLLGCRWKLPRRPHFARGSGAACLADPNLPNRAALCVFRYPLPEPGRLGCQKTTRVRCTAWGTRTITQGTRGTTQGIRGGVLHRVLGVRYRVLGVVHRALGVQPPRVLGLHRGIHQPSLSEASLHGDLTRELTHWSVTRTSTD